MIIIESKRKKPATILKKYPWIKGRFYDPR